MAMEVGPGLIEEAVNTTKITIGKIKTRTRLMSTKVKDIIEGLETLEKTVEEMKSLAPTRELLDSILKLNTELQPFITEARNLVRSLETFSDKVEAKIP